MLTLETTAQFRRDYKRIKKRGYNLKLLEGVIDALLAGDTCLHLNPIQRTKEVI